MPCSRPNVVGVNKAFGGMRFFGARQQEVGVLDTPHNPYENYTVYDVPCGKCDLCRLERRYTRALRIMLEAESYPGKTWFLTLTYNQDHIGDNKLDHRDWSQFIKNFRQKFCQAKYCNIRDRGTLRESREYSKTFKKIKQVMCGEYGDSFGRRHFHGIIFNHDFTDVYDTGRVSQKGNPVRSSKSLEEVWKKGLVQVEEVTFDLALYVGGYITDNDMDGTSQGDKQYGLFGRGIGLSWLQKYYRDVFAAGRIMLRDRDYPIPRYFFEKLKDICPDELEQFKQKRMLHLQNLRFNLPEKGDGLLRRSKTKGRIFKHNKEKRQKDEAFRIPQT